MLKPTYIVFAFTLIMFQLSYFQAYVHAMAITPSILFLLFLYHFFIFPLHRRGLHNSLRPYKKISTNPTFCLAYILMFDQSDNISYVPLLSLFHNVPLIVARSNTTRKKSLHKIRHIWIRSIWIRNIVILVS